MLRIALFLLYTQTLFASDVSVTAYHALDSQAGSLEVNIDTLYANAPYNIEITGPNGLVVTRHQSAQFFHFFPDLMPGEYRIVVQNAIGCEATLSIDILSCYRYPLIDFPGLIVCDDQLQHSEQTSDFTLISPLPLKQELPLNNLNLTFFVSESVSPEIRYLALFTTLEIIRQLQLDTETTYPYPETLDDYSSIDIGFAVRFDATGKLVWVLSNW